MCIEEDSRYMANYDDIFLVIIIYLYKTATRAFASVVIYICSPPPPKGLIMF